MLYGLDHALRRGGAYREALARRFDGLMMVACNACAALEHCGHKRPFHRHDGMQRHAEGRYAMVFRVACLGKVEHRFPAERVVQELAAAAYAEHREFALVRRMEQAGFKIIPCIADVCRLAFVALVVRAARRVDVAAAAKQHAVEDIPIVKRIRQDHGRGPNAVQGVAVSVVQMVMIPNVVVRRVAFVAGQADEGSLVHVAYCTPVFSLWYCSAVSGRKPDACREKRCPVQRRAFICRCPLQSGQAVHGNCPLGGRRSAKAACA